MVDSMAHRLGGRYEVRSLIGRGGMAEVHLGFDSRLSRIVAIKMLRTDLARDSVFQARFRREAQAAASLNHPNIVAVYDTGEEVIAGADGRGVSVPYIVMEYVEGHTVKDLLSDGTPVPIEEAIEIVSGVLSALEYSHAAGLVHRDIKPGNIMLTTEGKVKVMDFGIARALTDSQATMTQTNAVVGTAQYLSPEQARGEQVDTRSDLYSTGVVLFELLTGQPPFRGDSAVAVAYQHVSALPPTPSSVTPDVPEALDRVVMKALAKNREDRYSSAAGMRADLVRASRGAEVNAPATQVWAAAAGAGAAGGDPNATRTMQMAPPPPPSFPGPSRAAAASGAGAAGTMSSVRDEEEPPKRRVGLIVALVVVAMVLVGVAIAALLNPGEPEEVPQVAVPAGLVGMSQADAKAAVEAVELVWSISDKRVPSDTVPEGAVAQVNPTEGTMVDPGTEVVATLSSGPDSSAVPNLGGMTQDQAREALGRAGLTVGTVTQEDSAERDAGLVIRSTPATNESVPKGGAVNLVLASGNVRIPDGLSGQNQASVTQALQALKLNVNVQEYNADAEAGTVVMINPQEGQLVPQRSTVTIHVSLGPAPLPDPTPTPTPSPTPSASEPPGDGGGNGGNG